MTDTPAYAVNFRGFPACPCLAEWLPVYEAYLRYIGVLGKTESLKIWQLIGGAAASAGTHSLGGAHDTAQISVAAILAARHMGSASWHRPINWDGKGGMEHHHGVLNGCPHNSPALYQIGAYNAGFNGLGTAGHAAPDDGPRVLPLPNWQDGIKWAKAQMEAPVPTLVTGVDYSDARPAPKDIKAAGHTYVFRYLSHYSTAAKVITKAEADALHAVGLKIALVYEDGTDDPTRGAVEGHADAKDALAELKALGVPKGVVVFLAYDRNNYANAVGSADRAYGEAFVSDIKAAGYLAGGYGDWAVVHSGLFQYMWKVETWGADNSGVHVIQKVNPPIPRAMPGCDVNVVIHNFPTWNANTPTPTPTPKPTPTPTPTPKPTPVVSLSKVVAAAKADPFRPQGGQTPGAGGHVLLVEKALNAEGLLASQYVDGSYGSLTLKAYAAWQGKLGYKGKDADGIPGKVSLTALGKKHNFIVGI